MTYKIAFDVETVAHIVLSQKLPGSNRVEHINAGYFGAHYSAPQQLRDFMAVVPSDRRVLQINAM